MNAKALPIQTNINYYCTLKTQNTPCHLVQFRRFEWDYITTIAAKLPTT